MMNWAGLNADQGIQLVGYLAGLVTCYFAGFKFGVAVKFIQDMKVHV